MKIYLTMVFSIVPIPISLIKDFFWDDFADWYIEICKIRNQNNDNFSQFSTEAPDEPANDDLPW